MRVLFISRAECSISWAITAGEMPRSSERKAKAQSFSLCECPDTAFTFITGTVRSNAGNVGKSFGVRMCADRSPGNDAGVERFLPFGVAKTGEAENPGAVPYRLIGIEPRCDAPYRRLRLILSKAINRPQHLEAITARFDYRTRFGKIRGEDCPNHLHSPVIDIDIEMPHLIDIGLGAIASPRHDGINTEINYVELSRLFIYCSYFMSMAPND